MRTLRPYWRRSLPVPGAGREARENAAAALPRQGDAGPACLLALDGACVALGPCRFGPFSFRVAAGERIAVLGPSGAGKSTLLRLMAGELAPAAGALALDGRALAGWPLAELARRRAVLPQSGSVAFGLRCDLVIALGRVARAYDPQLGRIVREAARLARAGHLLERRSDTLSGGEQARVQLARVFAQLWDVHEGLLLVDEPLAALDPGLQFELLDGLERYARERGHAVIAVLHDLNHAMLGFDRLLLVRDGRLAGDLPAGAGALPALEALYGIGLCGTVDAQGDLVVTPMWRRPAPGAGLG